ncbi:hypothetical protein B0T19DRAFT_50769 [Cercophora scortea]|uniref:Uncharacterized protein n=1 Tax=Cercophora scortea TaxID=314031 RepID=A0AAE0J4I0_9PEZI|nr:hypothetical protein B0T19DRAFT_50769 [Cercophora scortea]
MLPVVCPACANPVLLTTALGSKSQDSDTLPLDSRPIPIPQSPIMSLDFAEERRAAQARVRRRKPWLDAARTPFRDDAPLVGRPGTTLADLELPRLRRCPFGLDSMVWESRLDGGADGYVWKVRFGDLQ